MKKPPAAAAKQLFARLLLITGPFLVGLSLTHNYLRQRALSLNAQVIAKYQALPQPAANPLPTHISSPWRLDVAIDPAIFQEGEWSISPDHASYLTSSARPGERGNIIIYGHNTRDILGNLRALKGGETITLTLSDHTTRDYLVETVTEVSPTRVDLLAPTNTETLTLYTCSGILDSQRFVVRATPLDLAAAPSSSL